MARAFIRRALARSISLGIGAGPVQEAVVAMTMQVGEGERAHGMRPPCVERLSEAKCILQPMVGR